MFQSRRVLWLLISSFSLVCGSTVKKNFVNCCELVQEIGGLIDYQQDPRWKDLRCLSVMSDLAPCFSACKEIHHGKVVDNASPSEAAAMVHHQLVLLISHFSSKHGHMREIEQSICANLMNGHIGKVVMLFEGTDAGCKQMALRFPSRKLSCRSLPHQPSYGDLFRAANHLPAGALAIVSNSDVVFDHSLRLLWPEALRATPTVFVLSVQPPEGNGYRGQYVDLMGERCPSDRLPANRCVTEGVCPGCSWDAYVFASPLAPTVDLAALNVHMNVLGAENLVGSVLESSGVMLLNPCQHVKAQHWHCEGKMHKPATPRVASFKDSRVLPCESCPFLRPYTAAPSSHASSSSGGGGGGRGDSGGGSHKHHHHSHNNHMAAEYLGQDSSDGSGMGFGGSGGSGGGGGGGGHGKGKKKHTMGKRQDRKRRRRRRLSSNGAVSVLPLSPVFSQLGREEQELNSAVEVYLLATTGKETAWSVGKQATSAAAAKEEEEMGGGRGWRNSSSSIPRENKQGFFVEKGASASSYLDAKEEDKQSHRTATTSSSPSGSTDSRNWTLSSDPREAERDGGVDEGRQQRMRLLREVLVSDIQRYKRKMQHRRGAGANNTMQQQQGEGGEGGETLAAAAAAATPAVQRRTPEQLFAAGVITQEELNARQNQRQGVRYGKSTRMMSPSFG